MGKQQILRRPRRARSADEQPQPMPRPSAARTESAENMLAAIDSALEEVGMQASERPTPQHRP